MTKGIQLAQPPRRRSEAVAEGPKRPQVTPESGVMFTQVAESEKVQFNKRVKRGVADGFDMLAIRTRKKVPDLLEEALGILEEKYGKV